jgi:hypothetical protein
MWSAGLALIIFTSSSGDGGGSFPERTCIRAGRPAGRSGIYGYNTGSSSHVCLLLLLLYGNSVVVDSASLQFRVIKS